MQDVWKPHATVAAIIEKDGKFLMVEEMSAGKRVYNQPAGHLDPGESLLTAAIRETQEETAWQFTPEYISGIYRWEQSSTNRCFLRFAFVGSCKNHDKDQQLDDGIIRALWLSREELAAMPDKLRSPMVLRCIDDYLKGKKYPLDLLTDIQ
ncbi:MAG: NUDIX hydrolase [Gammaproteobacteria bacterium]|nr:NUDIX hydrolase [Gammaproteobacteria bacterium]